MRERLTVGLLVALALVLLALAPAHSGAHPSRLSLTVPAHPAPGANVRITVHPVKRLPPGGYYYAVAVLVGYPGFSRASPPPCAISSDMRKTVYGSAHGTHAVRLTLIAARSAAHHWCPGASYEGGLYAVPHKPHCTKTYPCSGAGAEYGACWQIEGKPVCGVVVKPPQPKPEPPPEKTEPPAPEPHPSYSYPNGLPRPVDHSTHILARFTLRFGSG